MTDPTPLDVLRDTFGYQSFRPHQAEIADAALAGRDVLAVMPTSAGKSICYQVPALVLAARGAGLTLVVSPLISLMADQVGALRQAGVAASFLNSTLDASERASVLRGIASGALSLLYVAPERLDDPAFLQVLSTRGVALLAVDEAHCISQWGNDFRPSYQHITDFLGALPNRPPVMALTATATRAVREDIRASLGLRDPFVVLASFDRPNLSFAVARPNGHAEKDRMLVGFCRERADRSGIVYCSSRRAVEEVCDLLRDEGLAATRYHAGLSAEERHRNQDDFLYDRSRVMVATNAFGMGIDKSNVSYVIHYNLPLSLENYYQEAGRAGRDGTRADCLLLYSPGDVHTAEFLLSRTEPREDLTPEQRDELAAHDAERLRQMVFYATTTDCLRAFILRYFGEEAPAYCGNCSNCLTDFEEVDATVDALKVVSCVARIAQRHQSAGAAAIVDVLRGSRGEKTLRRGFDTLSTYGIMADVPARRIRALIDELAFRGVLARTAGDYPTIALTGASGAFLRREAPWDEPLVLKVARGTPRTARAAAPARGQTVTDVSELDELGRALYDELAELRGELAREQGVPAYFIFNNATLVEMCAKRPRTVEELLGVSGVGAKKAERYGELFLARIAEATGTGA
ncbi:DNA helicase RecQ [Olsenella profusa]|uniref:DNA helicase RecQ n=1 Tax=Olsenella profusa TaxID=138595 RepID=A0ABS2F055_9ACTN|nr:DNA helicase RecQ [Olsenella profusa]MBM6774351.1 DNA helicase RecQ [Olsenella profusa]